MIKNKEHSIPKFNNIEEEDKFWQSHSPLMEEHPGKVQKKEQNRASFLSIRLSGKELDLLRERATRYGLGPSTFARQVLIESLRSENRMFYPDSLVIDLSKHFSFTNIPDEQKEKYRCQLDQILNETKRVFKEYFRVQDEMLDTLNSSAPTTPTGLITGSPRR
jgi:predicted DNA binding CopG/RHH family protein